MPRVIPHRKNPKPPKPNKRYVVQRKDKEFPLSGWQNFGDHRYLWVAKLSARSWEKYGYFYYRVIDTWEDD